MKAGRRFALLAFYYGEAEARLRHAHQRRTGAPHPVIRDTPPPA